MNYNKRKVRGFDDGGPTEPQFYYSGPAATPPPPAPVLNPLEAATKNYNAASQALSSAGGGEDQGAAMANFQAARNAFLAAGGVEPKGSNNLGFIGDLFAGIDSSIGISKGVTAVSEGLADLDASLGLSKNAPAIIGIAAAYFLPGIGSALGQSLVSSGVITGAAIPYATTIGTALAQTGISVAQGKPLDQALGDAILSAGMGELTKAYGAGVKASISQITSNPVAQNAIFKAGTDVVTAVAQGKTGDQIVQGIGNSVVATVAGAAANEVVKNIPGINNLSETQKNIVKTGVATSIQGGDGTKSMVNAAITAGTNSVLDTLTSTPVKPPSVVAPVAPPAITPPVVVAPTSPPPVEPAKVVPPATTLDDIEATLAAAGLQNTGDTTDTTITDLNKAGLTETAPVTSSTVTGTALPPANDPSKVTPIKGGAADASTGTNYVTPIKGGAVDASTGTNYVTPITGGPADASTGTEVTDKTIANLQNAGLTEGKPGESGMAQTAAKTGGTDTANADEWGNLQGAIDDAAARGINAKAPTFSEAFSSWRLALGANGTFPWTDPKTGVTKVFTTDYAPATVAAISADPSAEIPATGEKTQVGLPITTAEGKSQLTDAEKSVNQRISEAYKGSTLSKIIGTPDDAMRTLVSMKDAAFGPAKGVIGGVKGIADFYDLATGQLDNPVSKAMRGLLSNTDQLTSDQTKATVKVMQLAVNQAAKDGQGSAAWETLKQMVMNPIITTGNVAQSVMTMFPAVAAAAPMIAAGIPISVATGTSIAINAVSQGGGVGKDAAERIAADAMESGLSPDQAISLSVLAARQAGLPAAAISVILNALPGGKALENAFANAAAKGTVRTLTGDVVREPLEELGGNFFKNYATNRPLNENVGQTLVESVVYGAGAGGVASTGYTASNVTETDARQILKDEGIIEPTLDQVKLLTSMESKEMAREEAAIYADPLVTNEAEARHIAEMRGYINPSKEVLASITGPISEADAQTELDTFLQSMSSFEAGKPVDAAAAQEMMADLGLSNMSDANAINLANQIVQSVPEDKLAPPADDFLDKTGVTNESLNTAGKQLDAAVTDDFMDKTGVTNEDLGVNNTGAAIEANTGNSTGTVQSVDSSANTALVVTNEGNVTVVDNSDGTLTTGDVINTGTDTNGVKNTIESDQTKVVATDVNGTDDVTDTAGTSQTPEQIQAIIDDAFAANPSLTQDQVAKIVDDAVKTIPSGVSKDEATTLVGTAITDATKDLATAKSVDDLKLDLTKAIDDAGKNNADAFDAIDKVIADLKAAGLTEQQVQDAVDLSVGGATKTLQDAIDAAVTGNTKALEDLQDQVATDIGTVQKSVTELEKTLVDTIAANEKAGLTRDEATQKALTDIADQMGTDKTDVLKQIGTTETNIAKKVTDLEDALGKKIEGTEKALATKLDDQGKAFMKALTDQGIDQQEAFDLALAAQTKLVTEGQKTTQKALGDLSTAQQKEVTDRVKAGETTDAAIAAVKKAVDTGQTDINKRIDDLVAGGLTQYDATQKAIGELSTGFTTQLTAAETARKADRDAAETARQTEITNQKAREAANLKTIQTGQLRGQMQSGLQGLIGGLQQQATQMAAPAQVETVKATPGFDFRSPLNTGFFGGYESQKTPPKNKESLKIATGGYLDDLLEAIR